MACPWAGKTSRAGLINLYMISRCVRAGRAQGGSGPGFDGEFLDPVGSKIEPQAGRAGKRQPPALGLDLAVSGIEVHRLSNL